MTLLLAQAVTESTNDNALLWGFILGGAALGILVLELLVPSGGLLGLLCGVAIIGSITAFFRYDTTFGFVSLLGYAILTPFVIVFGFKLWIQSPLARRMVLGGVDGSADGEGAPDSAGQPRLARQDQLRELIGAEGVTITALRPVGVVKINGQRVDAMAESGIVEANTPVVVADVYDNQIKVRPMPTSRDLIP
jgi:membrane-bound serine protease (ClpP class)